MDFLGFEASFLQLYCYIIQSLKLVHVWIMVSLCLDYFLVSGKVDKNNPRGDNRDALKNVKILYLLFWQVDGLAGLHKFYPSI